jgi:hypothetical protein
MRRRADDVLCGDGAAAGAVAHRVRGPQKPSKVHFEAECRCRARAVCACMLWVHRRTLCPCPSKHTPKHLLPPHPACRFATLVQTGDTRGRGCVSGSRPGVCKRQPRGRPGGAVPQEHLHQGARARAHAGLCMRVCVRVAVRRARVPHCAYVHVTRSHDRRDNAVPFSPWLTNTHARPAPDRSCSPAPRNPPLPTRNTLRCKFATLGVW